MTCNPLVREEERGDEGEGSGGDWGELGALVWLLHPPSSSGVALVEASITGIIESGASGDCGWDCGIAGVSSSSLESESFLAVDAGLCSSSRHCGHAVGSSDSSVAFTINKDKSCLATDAGNSSSSLPQGATVGDLCRIRNTSVLGITCILNQGVAVSAAIALSGVSTSNTVLGSRLFAFLDACNS